MSKYVRRRLWFGLLLTVGLFTAVFAIGNNGAIPVSSSYGGDQVQVPIIMYHSLLKDPERSGDYVITPALFEADLRYLLERGYTPVLIGDLISYVNGETDLPEKPVAITFDDGLLNNMLYLTPLLEQYDFCFTLSVVGEFTELFTATADPNPTYAYLTWEDVAVMNADPRIEIANHSYASHIKPASNASKAQLERHRERQVEDAAQMTTVLEQKSGVYTTVYTYPFGFQVRGTDDLLKDLGFEATLMCNEHMNTIVRGEPGCLFSLGRYNRPSGVSTEEFMRKALGAN